MRFSRAGALALAVALAAPGVASAEDAAVRVRVRVIQASKKGSEVDPRLKLIHRRLQDDFRFTAYKLVGEHTLDMAFNTPSRVKLPGDRMLKVLAHEVEPGQRAIKLHVEVEKEGEATPRVHTDYSIEPGGDLVIGGPKHGEDTLLVWLRHDKK
jgi:hypothetical protein